MEVGIDFGCIDGLASEHGVHLNGWNTLIGEVGFGADLKPLRLACDGLEQHGAARSEPIS